MFSIRKPMRSKLAKISQQPLKNASNIAALLYPVDPGAPYPLAKLGTNNDIIATGPTDISADVPKNWFKILKTNYLGFCIAKRNKQTTRTNNKNKDTNNNNKREEQTKIYK